MTDDDLARDLVEALRAIRRITEIIASLDASETAAQELDEQADRRVRLEGRMTGNSNTQ